MESLPRKVSDAFQKSLCRDSVRKWLNTIDICSKRSPFFALIFAVSLMKDSRFVYQALMQRNKSEDWELEEKIEPLLRCLLQQEARKKEQFPIECRI